MSILVYVLILCDPILLLLPNPLYPLLCRILLPNVTEPICELLFKLLVLLLVMVVFVYDVYILLFLSILMESYLIFNYYGTYFVLNGRL